MHMARAGNVTPSHSCSPSKKFPWDSSPGMGEAKTIGGRMVQRNPAAGRRRRLQRPPIPENHASYALLEMSLFQRRNSRAPYKARRAQPAAAI